MPKCFISFKNQHGHGGLIAKQVVDILYYYNCEVYYFPEDTKAENYRIAESAFLNETEYFILVITDDLIMDLISNDSTPENLCINDDSECLFEIQKVFEIKNSLDPEWKEKNVVIRPIILPVIPNDFKWSSKICKEIDKKEYLFNKIEILKKAIGKENTGFLKYTNRYRFKLNNNEFTERLIQGVGLVFNGYTPIALNTRSGDGIFIPSQEFKPPDKMIEKLNETAFKNNIKVHAITGRRGMGKTTLAKYFAEKCALGDLDPQRPDLKFEHVIIKDYEDRGLQSTIEMLKLDRDIEQSFSYDQKIQLLKKLAKPALLIIDNYDSPQYKKELVDNADGSNVYIDIINTGCHILITSRNDMRNCYGLKRTEIQPLITDDLIDLFNELSGLDIAGNDSDLRIIIEKNLLSNTYLVTLTAKLMDWNDISEIKEALEKHKMMEIDDRIEGRNNDSDTWFGHFSKLFEISKIEDDEEKLRLMFNTALLPPGGIRKEDYKKYFIENAQQKEAFRDLSERFWILTSDNKISMHPALREIIARRKDIFKYIFVKNYVDTLNKKLLFHTYNSDLPDMLKLGVEASEILGILNVREPEFAYLNARISSNYDIIDINHSAYDYGIRSINLLNELKPKITNDNDKFEFAQAYNLAGYSILHAKKEKDYLKIACKALIDDAGKLISQFYDPEKADSSAYEKYKVLYTMNQGNIAACYLARGIINIDRHNDTEAYQDINKALEIHKENIRIRTEWLNELKEDDKELKKERLTMLATSYMCVGTDLYHLRKTVVSDQEKSEYMKDSYVNHSKALEKFTEAYKPDYHIQIATAENRRAGAMIFLIDHNAFETEKEKISMCRDVIEGLEKSINYITEMFFPNQKELEDSKTKLDTIISQINNLEGIESDIIKRGNEAVKKAEKCLYEIKNNIKAG